MPAACFSDPMSMTAVKRGACGALLLVFTAAAAAAQNAERLRNHFDSDGLLREPAFFDFLVLGPPGKAVWKVLGANNPPSAPNQVSQVMPARPADSIAVACRRNVSYRDGAWSLALRRGSGRGGIVFRMTGEGDFLVLLVDLTTGEARLSFYSKGRATELAKGVRKPKNEWGILKILATGPRVTAEWDGESLLEAVDPNPAAGRTGMATAGPGVVSFDEFILEPASEPGR